MGLGDPGAVPDFLPDPVWAGQICEVFGCEVHRRWPHFGFRGTRRTPPEPVTSLVECVCVRSYDSYVPEVDSENAAIVLEPPCLFDDSLPWTVGSQVVAPIHVTDTKIYLESADDLEPGVKVSQSSHVGSLDALFSAFREQWQKRWCRHSNLPHSHREPFVLAMTFSQSIMTHWPAFVVLLLGLRQMGVGLVRSSVAESQA